MKYYTAVSVLVFLMLSIACSKNNNSNSASNTEQTGKHSGSTTDDKVFEDRAAAVKKHFDELQEAKRKQAAVDEEKAKGH